MGLIIPALWLLNTGMCSLQLFLLFFCCLDLYSFLATENFIQFTLLSAVHLKMFAIIYTSLLHVLKLEVLEYLFFHNNEDVFLHQIFISVFFFLSWAFWFRLFVLDALIHNHHQKKINFINILFLFIALVYY